MRQAGEESGERPGIVGQGIGPDRRAASGADLGVGIEMPVGIEHRRADLRREAAQRMQGQRHAFVQLQSLVDAAHAAAAAAGKHQSGDVLLLDHPWLFPGTPSVENAGMAEALPFIPVSGCRPGANA